MNKQITIPEIDALPYDIEYYLNISDTPDTIAIAKMMGRTSTLIVWCMDYKGKQYGASFPVHKPEDVDGIIERWGGRIAEQIKLTVKAVDEREDT